MLLLKARWTIVCIIGETSSISSGSTKPNPTLNVRVGNKKGSSSPTTQALKSERPPNPSTHSFSLGSSRFPYILFSVFFIHHRLPAQFPLLSLPSQATTMCLLPDHCRLEVAIKSSNLSPFLTLPPTYWDLSYACRCQEQMAHTQWSQQLCPITS